ncbi:KxYKxGKxW signal peptide domain-containing protein, partial [Streptococcus orisasini]
MKNTHYKLHKVKKQWVVIAVTTMAGLSLMTVGTTSSVSADSQPQDSQVVQVTQNDQSVVGDGAQVSSSEQPIQAEDSTTNSQSASAEEVAKANQPQAGSIATQDDHQDSPELNQTTADSVTPASDGGVVYTQSPQLVSQSEQSTTTTKGITEKQISEPVPVENRVTASDAQRAEINKILDDHSSG